MAVTQNNRSTSGDLQLSRAMSLFESGQFAEASDLCGEILRIDPQHSEALHVAGVASLQMGNVREACRTLRQAVDRNPTSAVYQSNLGAAYRDLGDLENAVVSLQRALELDPKFTGAHFNLGLCFESLKRTSDAIQCYENVIQLEPGFAAAYLSLGTFLARIAETSRAIQTFQKGIQAIPHCAELHFHLANTLRSTGGYQEAYDSYLAARQLAPSIPEIHNNLGTLLNEMGRLPEAGFCFQQAIQANPQFADAHNNLGVVLQKQRRYTEAKASFEEAIRQQPELASAHCNLGVLARECGDEQTAIANFQRAVDVSPDNADALNNLGDALEEQGDFEKAAACFQKTQKDDLESIEAQFHLAQQMLRQGDFQKGWKQYELRWQRAEANRRDAGLETWEGSFHSEQPLVVLTEQGVGDEILFASCLPDVANQKSQLILECDARLEPLFKRSFPSVSVAPKPVGHHSVQSLRAELPAQQTTIGTLPQFTRPELSSFPRRRAFLVPNPNLCQQWQSRLKELGQRLKIGISWRGGVKESIRRKKSTTLMDWKPVLAINDVAFVNLQYGDATAELKACRDQTGVAVHDFAECAPLHNLDEFAALVASLDIVISVSNTTVHMSGALGVPTWTLLSFVADWRWMLDRVDSPWYDSIRLFRQPQRGDWAPVFAEVAEELSRFADEH